MRLDLDHGEIRKAGPRHKAVIQRDPPLICNLMGRPLGRELRGGRGLHRRATATDTSRDKLGISHQPNPRDAF